MKNITLKINESEAQSIINALDYFACEFEKDILNNKGTNPCETAIKIECAKELRELKEKIESKTR